MASTFKIKLYYIPQILTHHFTTYDLRGVIFLTSQKVI